MIRLLGINGFDKREFQIQVIQMLVQILSHIFVGLIVLFLKLFIKTSGRTVWRTNAYNLFGAQFYHSKFLVVPVEKNSCFLN